MKQRATLAYLLLHPNTVVPASQLLDALWPDEAMPTSARKILHNAVWGLRNLFPGDSSEPIALISRPPGYLLEVDTDRIDLYRFHRLADLGRAAAAAGDLDAGAARLGESLSLWRGSALSDLTEHGVDWPKLAAAEDARMSVSEDYFEIELRRGNHAKVIDALSALAESNQLRERSCGQLMLALYRNQRPSDALAVYTAWRNTLIENHGLEPGSELQQLQQAILRQSPSLLLPGAAPKAALPREHRGGTGPNGATDLSSRRAGRVVAPTAEVTHATVLFIQVDQADTAPGPIADTPMIGDQFLPTIRATVESLGGIVVGVICSTVITVFPAPCEVHDVVAAAIHLNRWVTAVRTEIASGIAPRFRAAVVTGEAEGRLPQTYADLRNKSMYCDLFDDCERLLFQAPDGVVTVSWRARRESEHVIRYLRHPTGQWHALGIGVALEDAHTSSVEPDPDVRMLLGMRERVRHRAVSHLVAVVAPAAACAREVAREFRNTLLGQGDSDLILCARFGGADHLEMHRTMLADVCGFRADDPPAEISAKLADAARDAQRPPNAVSQLAEALHPLATSTGATDPIQARTMFAAWTELLCAKAGLQPTTLIFEDAHLADQASLDFLETLLDRAENAPLLVVLTGEGSLARSRFARITGTRESTLITCDFGPGRQPADRRQTNTRTTTDADRPATVIAAS
ncbi:BTAD domain-containing putative transcriptional regulator [Nocardia sp. NPDC051787]|uniref:AfsR/SARP family transcriptional regulator n=1 Tax=Nocardia sp. NPDC051787 TaxID=3155415 RepID=UPI00343108D9